MFYTFTRTHTTFDRKKKANPLSKPVSIHFTLEFAFSYPECVFSIASSGNSKIASYSSSAGRRNTTLAPSNISSLAL